MAWDARSGLKPSDFSRLELINAQAKRLGCPFGIET
jgi:hypothetical protein